ncbi:MAG: AtpZ/AtpI family protein [Phycisphaerales bacterium JB040]
MGDPDRKNDYSNQAKAWVIALNVVYGTIGFGMMGFAVDYFAGTTPRWLLIGCGTGLFVGTYRFIREALELNKSSGGDSNRTGASDRGPGGKKRG